MGFLTSSWKCSKPVMKSALTAGFRSSLSGVFHRDWILKSAIQITNGKGHSRISWIEGLKPKKAAFLRIKKPTTPWCQTKIPHHFFGYFLNWKKKQRDTFNWSLYSIPPISIGCTASIVAWHRTLGSSGHLFFPKNMLGFMNYHFLILRVYPSSKRVYPDYILYGC